jgi:hypothetical protein
MDMLESSNWIDKPTLVEWHGKRWVFSEQRALEEMRFLLEECERRRLPLLHCKETVLVDHQGIPLIESRLGPATRRE